MRFKQKAISIGIVTATIVYSLSYPAAAFCQTPYYAGKTITIVRGGGPGGSGDFQARALMPFLTKHIPGNPAVIMEMMPGAAGRRAANHLFNAAKPDGLTIGSAEGAVLPARSSDFPGEVRYRIDKLSIWAPLKPATRTSFIVKRKRVSILSRKYAALPACASARTQSATRFTSPRVSSRMYSPRNPTFVVGFTNPELNIAMERGEVDGRTTSNIDDLFRDGLAGKYHFHAMIQNPKGRTDARFPKLPDLLELTDNKKVAQVVDLFRAFQYPRWPIICRRGSQLRTWPFCVKL